MQIKNKIIVKDGKVIEEQYFEDVCCDNMREALLAQETSLADPAAVLWLSCPFCQEEIHY